MSDVAIIDEFRRRGIPCEVLRENFGMALTIQTHSRSGTFTRSVDARYSHLSTNAAIARAALELLDEMHADALCP